MAKKETKDVTIKTDTALAEYAEGSWGSDSIESQDLIIPRLLVMQGLSDLVTEGKAAMGEFRSSLDAKLLGGEKKPVEFVVFNSFKDWMIMEDGDYVQTVPVTPENEAWQFEEVIAGKLVKRMKGINYYVLLVSDIEAGEAFPYILTFRSTSFNAGKKLATHLAKLRMFKQPSAAQVFALSATREKNDKGTFMVLNVAPSRKATEVEKAAAYQWYQGLKVTKNVKVADEVPTNVASNRVKADTVMENTEY